MQIPIEPLTKDQLWKAQREMIGKINRAPMNIGGRVYGPGEVVFQGFVGRSKLRETPVRFHGVYRFRESQPRDSERDWENLYDLPNLPPEVTDVRKDAGDGRPASETAPGEDDATIDINIDTEGDE